MKFKIHIRIAKHKKTKKQPWHGTGTREGSTTTGRTGCWTSSLEGGRSRLRCCVHGAQAVPTFSEKRRSAGSSPDEIKLA